MILRNFTNAFVRIETGPVVLICDPWKFPVWDGGWRTMPFHTPIQEALRGATHCFISHLHEDHCDPLALAFLPRDTVMIAPAMPPNHLIALRLAAMGFTEVRSLPFGEPVELGCGARLEIIPPLNRFAQEQDLYDDEDAPSTGIDCGALITDAEARVVLLSDNSPYNIRDAGPALERISGCDLLAFPFNGYADDYPVCYDSFSEAEKRSVAHARGAKRQEMTARSLSALAPRALLPYSSDFLVHGPRALQFADILPAAWMDRQSAARAYEAATGIPNLVLWEDDVIRVGPGGIEYLRRASHPLPPVRELAEAQYNPVPNTRHLFRPIESPAALAALVARSAANLFEQMERRRLTTEWVLELRLTDLPGITHVLDLRERRQVDAVEPGRKVLTCHLESNYLQAILTGGASWNGAQGSYNLTWERRPAAYDFYLYRSLHFFNLPGSGTRTALAGTVRAAAQ